MCIGPIALDNDREVVRADHNISEDELFSDLKAFEECVVQAERFFTSAG